jgi:hypothetical protein
VHFANAASQANQKSSSALPEDQAESVILLPAPNLIHEIVG